MIDWLIDHPMRSHVTGYVVSLQFEHIKPIDQISVGTLSPSKYPMMLWRLEAYSSVAEKYWWTMKWLCKIIHAQPQHCHWIYRNISDEVHQMFFKLNVIGKNSQCKQWHTPSQLCTACNIRHFPFDLLYLCPFSAYCAQCQSGPLRAHTLLSPLSWPARAFSSFACLRLINRGASWARGVNAITRTVRDASARSARIKAHELWYVLQNWWTASRTVFRLSENMLRGKTT